MEKEELIENIKSILKADLSKEEKKSRLLQYHENDIADVIDSMTSEERKEVYDILGDEFTGEVLLYSDDITEAIDGLEPGHVADIIETMDADDAIDVLEELDDDQREEIVKLIDDEVIEDIKAISKYDDDMIGSRMTNNYITILSTDTVKSAMKMVIKEAAENDNVSTIFVLDEDEKFYGVLDLRDLIIARDGKDLKEIIKRNYPYFFATDLVSEKLVDLKEYALNSYPILDEQLHLVGVLTSDDILEVLDDESGEDYAKLAGLTEEENLDESVAKSVKKRIPWLIVLLVLGLIQAFTMTGFEKVVAALPLIVFFQTLILDMDGNTGTQSLAVTIRMISTNEIKGRDILKTIFKEIRIGFLNGMFLALLSFGFVLLYLLIANRGIKENSSFEIFSAMQGAGIIGISLLVAMTVSSMIGSLVPIIFLKIHVDPAVASGPFITTINDITALLIYYGLAALMLSSL